MKQFFKMFFASFLALVVAGVIILGLTIGLIAGLAGGDDDEGKKFSAHSVLVIEMDKNIRERGETNPFAALGGNFAYAPGLYDITKAIEHAATDKHISGILIKMNPSPNGWATLQQLRQSLLNFKTNKKFIYAYGEIVPQQCYYLASVADSIFINPAGLTEIKGLSTEIPFFKGALDKLEVQPEIFYAGKFKSATEPFRADHISEANKEQLSDLQASVWNEFTQAVAAHARVNAATVDSWAQNGTIHFPEAALQHKLIDRLAYMDQVENTIREQLNKKPDEKINYVALDEYAGSVRKRRKTENDRIALLVAEGNITEGRGNGFEIATEDVIENIRKVKKDNKVKAVVLRISSPGGSALASEIILRELQLLREKKPLIVSMGDIAASGGYYMSCQADSIFAMPNTFTGSIGVYAMLFNAEKLLNNKLGISFDEVKNAPYADFPTVTRAITPDEAAKMQAHVDTIYETFKRRVATGRRMSPAKVDSIAQGRIWSGTDALKIGLVDGLGGIDRAIWSAAKKAGLKDYQVVTYPQPIESLENLMRRFQEGDFAAMALNSSFDKEMTAWIFQLKKLAKMNARAQMIVPFDIRMN